MTQQNLVEKSALKPGISSTPNKSMERLRGLIKSPTEMTPGEKLKRAMELSSLGLKMKWQTLRRDSPEASESEVQQQFESWLYRRDTAPLGDFPGRQRQVN